MGEMLGALNEAYEEFCAGLKYASEPESMMYLAFMSGWQARGDYEAMSG